MAYLTVLMSTYTTVFVGYYGDHIVSKFGKRKPLVVVGYAIACIGYVNIICKVMLYFVCCMLYV